MNHNKKILNLVKEQIKLIFKSDLLLEADFKKKILNTFPIPESTAEYVANRLGKLSLWFLNALSKRDFDSKEGFLRYINERPFYIRANYDSGITKILDWIRHPLVTGTVDLRNLTLQNALDNSDEFHENLKALGGDIDYVEQNKKLVQYDNRFYWAEIPSNYSQEECNRMGHCGRTNKGDMLFSLRSDIDYGKGHTLNDSHLTVAYNKVEGLIYQSKGKKNSKPSEKYFPYFFDLILRLPRFNGFGKEYQNSQDINFSDFTNNQLQQLLQKFPDAFKTYSAQKILADRGIIEKIEAKKTLILDLKVDEIDGFLRIDRNLRDNIIEIILQDPDELYSYDYADNWKYMIDYVNSTNKQTILEYIENNFPDIDISGGDLEDIMIDNEDELYKVIIALNQAVRDAEAQDYERYCYDQLKNDLEYWGTVDELNYDGAKIEVNIDNFLDNVDAGAVEDAMDRCNDDRECAFHELVANGDIESPLFSLNNRYTPTADRQNFNEILVDTLSLQLSN